MSKKVERASILESLCEIYGEDLLCMDGYDDCICGVVTRYGQSPIVCYDKHKVLSKHQNDGMTAEEANEFFEFNQLGAYVGEFTPCFIELVEQPCHE